MIPHGHPYELKARIGGERVEVVLADAAQIPATKAVLAELSAGEIRVEEETCTVTAAVTRGVDTLREVLEALKDRSIAVADVGLRRPTLDDVFLSLTGHAAEEAMSSPDGKRAGRDEAKEKETVP